MSVLSMTMTMTQRAFGRQRSGAAVPSPRAARETRWSGPTFAGSKGRTWGHAKLEPSSKSIRLVNKGGVSPQSVTGKVVPATTTSGVRVK